jgi:hypothetical protein
LGLHLGLVGLGLSACGTLGGGSTNLNDPAPDGILLRQAPFFGQNGQTVSGTAAIYTGSSGVYILRLEGLTAPEESGLQVRVTGNGIQVFSSSLRASSGSMNYTMNVSAVATWNSVTLFSTANAKSYGTATF